MRERPFEKSQAADSAHRQWASERSDFVSALNLYDALEKVYSVNQSYSALRRYAQSNFLNYRRVREWRNLVEDLNSIIQENTRQEIKVSPILTEFDYDALHRTILSGLPRQLGYFDREQKNYFDMSGKRFKIFPGSALAKRKSLPEWILSFALVETSQVFGRCCAEVKGEWLLDIAPQLCKSVYDQVAYSPQNGFVAARERITCGRLLIHPGRRRHYGPIAPREAREIFIQEALINHNISEHLAKGIPWLEKFLQSARKVRKFELKMRRPEMLFNEAELREFFTASLPENFYSLQEIRNHWKRFHKNFSVPENLLWERENYPGDPEKDFPDELIFSDVPFPLEYTFDPGGERDGITLIADEETVNLLPRWALEAVVPGFLEEKLEFYLKSLVRQDRQKIAPMSSFITDFCRRWKSGNIFNERSLGEALSDELNKYSVVVNSNAFADVPLPEYLQMKLLIIDSENREKELLKEVPALEKSSSKLSGALPRAQAFCCEAGKSFPLVPTLPTQINLTDKSADTAYPALFSTEDGLVGSAVYLKEAEARCRHDEGLFALLKLQLTGLLGAIRKDFKLAAAQEKRFFKNAAAENAKNSWKDDLLYAAVLKALGDADQRWQIRSKNAFDNAREAARSRFADSADELESALKYIFEQESKVQTLLRKLPDNSTAAGDINNELAFYFRNGFLRGGNWHENYKRYLRGLELRLQRLIANPRQDALKYAPLEPYVEKLNILLGTLPELESAPMVYDFVLLMQELRLSVFAPEVRTRRKVSLEIIKKSWDQLRC